MVRRTVEVVPVTPDLVPHLVALWMEARVDAGASPEMASRAANDGRASDYLGRSDVGAWLARMDGSSIGFVICSDVPFGLSAAPEVAVQQLFVCRPVRRLGVALALLSAVVSHAERVGSEVVVSNVPAQSRDANRFFARLGFGSVTMRRVATTSALRRRLTPAQASVANDIVRRRRTLRRSEAEPVHHHA